MTSGTRRRLPWRLTAIVVVLIGGPFLLYSILPLIGIPATVAWGVATVIALKHLGLLAALMAPLYALRQRRPRP